MNKSTKFALIIFLSIGAALIWGYQTGAVTIDWNGLFNGTLQSLVAGVILVPVTVIVYRFLYHRKSRS